MTDRPHLYRVLEDADGNPLRGASYQILNASGGPLGIGLFETNDGSAPYPASGTTTTGVIDCFFATPARILLQFTPPGSVQPSSTIIDVESPYTFALPSDLSVTNVPQAVGDVLTAIDADSAQWAAPSGGGGGTTIDPTDPSTVPQFTFQKDISDIVWVLSVGTDGSLDTFPYPLPVNDIVLNANGSFSFNCPDYLAHDSFSAAVQDQPYLGQPSDLYINAVATFTQGSGTAWTGQLTSPTLSPSGDTTILRIIHQRGPLNSNGAEVDNLSSLPATGSCSNVSPNPQNQND